jgi:hypothetical protein
VVEKPPPKGAGALLEPGFPLIFQEEEAPALGASVKELRNIVFRAALQTAVDQVPAGRRKEMGADIIRKFFEFQGSTPRYLPLLTKIIT